MATAAVRTPLEDIYGDIVDLVESLDQHGLLYAARYHRHVTEGGPNPKPEGLNLHVAKAIRELVLDRNVACRLAQRVRS